MNEKEKEYLEDIRKSTKTDYYYDNPSQAIGDVEWLIKLVEKLNAKIK